MERNKCRRKLLQQASGSRISNEEIDRDKFLEGMDKTNTEYVVVSSGSRVLGYLKDAGLRVVGTTENHTVLHYDLKDPKIFEPADYSEVWANE